MSQSHQIIIVTGWLLSIVALVVTIAVVMRIIKKREKTESTVPVWIVYAIGIFVTAFILVLSQNIVDLGGTPDAPNILDSLLSSLQMFVLGRGIDLNIEMLEWMGPLLLVYAVYNAALFLAVPAATAGTVISLIGQMLSVPRMLSLARKRGVHVFSELNEKSLTLAKSVYEDEGTAEHLVVFANVRDDDVALASDAKSAGMVCLAQSVSFIASRIGSRSFKRTYVFSSDDEVSNLGNGITLARQLVEQHVVGDPTPYVFMFSSSPVAGAVVDAVSSEVNASLGENADASDIKVRLKRVDWIRNTVDMLLDTYPLFATGLDEGCMDGLEFEPKLTFDYEPSKRHILIVGESMFAVEYLKGVLWAGQFGDEIEVQIDVVTPGVETLKRRFAFESPEFFATDGRPYQDRYNLRFYSFDPQGDDYLNYLLESGSEFGEIDQVLVAIDDDLVFRARTSGSTHESAKALVCNRAGGRRRVGLHRQERVQHAAFAAGAQREPYLQRARYQRRGQFRSSHSQSRLGFHGIGIQPTFIARFGVASKVLAVPRMPQDRIGGRGSRRLDDSARVHRPGGQRRVRGVFQGA